MEIVRYTEEYRNSWQKFVFLYGDLYHDIRWKYIIEESYKLKSHYYIVLDKSEIIALFPAFQDHKNRLISLPYVNYSSLCIKPTVDINCILHLLLSGINTDSIFLKWKTSGCANEGYITMIKELSDDIDNEWDNMKSKLRNQVRNSNKQNMTLKNTGVREFYPLYSKATNALGTPRHKKIFFSNIAKYFQNETRIHNLYHDNTAIGTIFEIDYLNTRYDLWMFSLKKYFHYLPNVFTYWKTIEDCIEKRIRYYDFGRSIYGDGTFKFKKQWGAMPVSLNYKKYMKDGNSLIDENIPPLSSKVLPYIWKNTPQFITNRVGPIIRKYLV